ncbi:hypothetical protein [Acinetobacter dispersus]|uniref:hypothetical protein n=1 Tax=Acinetobacter dispersus TaxID=70348 RepID=UPI001F4B0673|nr:hypothetical protein [Acinetobacter dispersus]MCH7391635.1 hypothetical protein [Acinetobacter dispersus]
MSTSLLFKRTLDLDGDYLSAFATLVAALVAFLLFNDWKVEHKFRLLEQYHSSLKERSTYLNNLIDAMTAAKSKVSLFNVHGVVENTNQDYFEKGGFYKDLVGVMRLMEEYQYCLETLENCESLRKNKETVCFYQRKFREISNEYWDSKLRMVGRTDLFIVSTEALNSWKKTTIEFEHFCSVELADFYFNYLNRKN